MKKASTLFLLLTLFITASLTAQTTDKNLDYTKLSKTEKRIINLQTGINSNNLGLKHSAIYFTGLYKYSENVPLLVNEYKKTDNQKTKNLIAFTLFILDDGKALEAINFDSSKFANENNFAEIVDGFRLTSRYVVQNKDK